MTSTSTEGAGTTFLIPAALAGPSGGSRFNECLVNALEAIGHPVCILGVPGSWPRPGDADLLALGTALAGRSQVVIDGLMASAAPEEIRAAVAAGTRVHILFHLSLLAEGGLEPAEAERVRTGEHGALRAAHTVICTSNWAAGDVVDRYGPLPTVVVLPGTTPAPLAGGSSPPHLLMLASLTPRKNQLAVLRALASLTDLPWRTRLVGPDTMAPDYARRVRDFAATTFAPERVQVTGALTGSELEEIWAGTDLLLLVSRAETFGMVVTEALAHGIPAVVGAGTGAEEALALAGAALPGAAVEPDDPVALEAVLRHWLTTASRRASWQHAAVNARDRLPTWNQSANHMLRILAP
ncbi:glycosyltransferase family 4 protein [Arthrobacter rhombi]|uniref:glycosyltransferase family 4 protein n=1 Tax=Arthrobacter rhombi TaxID=71253 RepID=UPI003F8F3C0A